MTPKEKAKDMVGTMYTPYFMAEFVTISNSDCRKAAKTTALIAVTQILNLAGLPQYQIVFWRKVKESIIKL